MRMVSIAWNVMNLSSAELTQVVAKVKMVSKHITNHRKSKQLPSQPAKLKEFTSKVNYPDMEMLASFRIGETLNGTPLLLLDTFFL